MGGFIESHHQGQTQLFTMFSGEGQADEATAEAGHEVDGLRRDLVRRHDQIALVFTFLVIHDHDHPAASQIINNLFDTV